MPYAEHPAYTSPPDNVVLWRYLDFAKFIDLIERKKLWFCRADKFEDPLEGTFTDAEIRRFESVGPDGEPLFPGLRGLTELSPMARGTTFVNCWREGEYESMAMWDIYGKGSGVVAIKSTVGLLKEAFAPYRWDIYLSRVKYMDWNKLGFLGNTFELCIRKDMSYAHECEVRAIIWGLGFRDGMPPLYQVNEDNSISSIADGEELDVDPARLITEVVVGPREQSRILNLVQVVMKRYRLTQPVSASDRLKARERRG
jgi:hypothetical protein